MQILRDFVAALQDLAKAIREHGTSSQREQKPPADTNVQVTVGIPPAASDYYAAENTERPKNTKREGIRLVVEIAGLITVIIGGTYAGCTFKQAQRQANTAQAQFILSERPWLAVTGIDITKVDSSDPTSPMFRLEYKISNFGRTIASLNGFHAILSPPDHPQRAERVCRDGPENRDEWGVLPNPELPFIAERTYWREREYNPAGEPQEWRKDVQPTISGYDPTAGIAVQIDGCLFYSSRAETRTHTTRFIATMSHRDPAGKCPAPNSEIPIRFIDVHSVDDICVNLVWTRGGKDSN